VQIPEDRISSLFEDQGDDDEAQRADAELPRTADEHAGLSSTPGLDPADLLTKLGGGGLAGGIAGTLGL
jgi:hypothetical protein